MQSSPIFWYPQSSPCRLFHSRNVCLVKDSEVKYHAKEKKTVVLCVLLQFYSGRIPLNNKWSENYSLRVFSKTSCSCRKFSKVSPNFLCENTTETKWHLKVRSWSYMKKWLRSSKSRIQFRKSRDCGRLPEIFRLFHFVFPLFRWMQSFRSQGRE